MIMVRIGAIVVLAACGSVLAQEAERAWGPQEELCSIADERVSEREILSRFEIPERALRRLTEVGVLSPNDDGYSQADVRIVEAVARFREAGWNEKTGFGARDVARLMQGLEPVISDELELLVERFSALGPDRAGDIVEGGASPFPALIGALHAKLLTADPDSPLNTLIDDEQPALDASMPGTAVAAEFENRDFISAPVVDENNVLLGHITIDDVGGTAVYLASDLSSAVTGEVVYVDGGFNILGVPSGSGATGGRASVGAGPRGRVRREPLARRTNSSTSSLRGWKTTTKSSAWSWLTSMSRVLARSQGYWL